MELRNDIIGMIRNVQALGRSAEQIADDIMAHSPGLISTTWKESHCMTLHEVLEFAHYTASHGHYPWFAEDGRVKQVVNV